MTERGELIHREDSVSDRRRFPLAQSDSGHVGLPAAEAEWIDPSISSFFSGRCRSATLLNRKQG